MVWVSGFYRFWEDGLSTKTKRRALEGIVTFEGFLCQTFGDFYDFTSLGFFKDPRDAFRLGFYLDKKHFPEHFLFANIQCLRCGICCKRYENVIVAKSLVRDWKEMGETDILKHVNFKDRLICFVPRWKGCPFCQKAKGKPYNRCRINSFKKRIPVCKTYLCSKSLPVANLKFKDVDELIELIGLRAFTELTMRDWIEDFDNSNSHNKINE